MWIKWRRPGSHGRRGEYLSLTEQLSPRRICNRLRFGGLGSGIIVFRLKMQPSLPEAVVKRWVQLSLWLSPCVLSSYLRCWSPTATFRQGLTYFGWILWEKSDWRFDCEVMIRFRADHTQCSHIWSLLRTAGSIKTIFKALIISIGLTAASFSEFFKGPFAFQAVVSVLIE